MTRLGRATALLLALAAPAFARADVLHLQGGGVIDADRWWIEGDTLHVESAGGQIGLPRTMLVRVEPAAQKASPRPDARNGRGKPASDARSIAPTAHSETRVSQETVAKMREGNEALASRDFERAAIKFYEVMEDVPDAPGPRVGYATAEMALGRNATALPVVLDGLVRDPKSAELHELLGTLYDRDERVEDALASWREAFRLAPSDRVRDKIVKAERELQAGREYRFSAAAHFTLRYDGALDQDLVAAMTDFLEDRFRDLTGTYRHAPSQPITVLLYPKQAFRDVTQAGNEVAGLFDGKIRVPLGGLKRLEPDAERVLSHELTHAIVQSKTRGNCPRWLHEGLAQMSEPRALRRSDIAMLARSVRPNDPATWPEASFSYPSALSFTRYLEKQKGFDVLVDLLARLGDGETLDKALSALYGADYRELATAWAEAVHTEAGP